MTGGRRSAVNDDVLRRAKTMAWVSVVSCLVPVSLGPLPAHAALIARTRYLRA